MTVLIPAKNTMPYECFARGAILDKSSYFPGEGIYIKFYRGTVILFYTHQRSRQQRRAVVLRDSSCEPDSPFLSQPVLQVIDHVRVLGTYKGRKVDLLKRLIYFLEKNYDDIPYSYGEDYWIRVLALLDYNYDGKEAGMFLANLKNINQRYEDKMRLRNA